MICGFYGNLRRQLDFAFGEIKVQGERLRVKREQRHCEGDSPKQSGEKKAHYFRIASPQVARNDEQV
jgi:hypothetical protein